MSWQLKFLAVLAVIVLGTVLYLKRPPGQDDAAPAASIPLAGSPDVSQPSDHNKVTSDLWSAIAPCWNGIAGSSTLPVKLKLSFDAKGELASPPEIERNPDAVITNQNLQSEALALQTVSACAPYRMAREQQGVEVLFPAIKP